jgi:hypothetical protein
LRHSQKSMQQQTLTECTEVGAQAHSLSLPHILHHYACGHHDFIFAVSQISSKHPWVEIPCYLFLLSIMYALNIFLADLLLSA